MCLMSFAAIFTLTAIEKPKVGKYAVRYTELITIIFKSQQRIFFLKDTQISTKALDHGYIPGLLCGFFFSCI